MELVARSNNMAAIRLKSIDDYEGNYFECDYEVEVVCIYDDRNQLVWKGAEQEGNYYDQIDECSSTWLPYKYRRDNSEASSLKTWAIWKLVCPQITKMPSYKVDYNVSRTHNRIYGMGCTNPVYLVPSYTTYYVEATELQCDEPILPLEAGWNMQETGYIYQITIAAC